MEINSNPARDLEAAADMVYEKIKTAYEFKLIPKSLDILKSIALEFNFSPKEAFYTLIVLERKYESPLEAMRFQPARREDYKKVDLKRLDEILGQLGLKW